MFSFNSDRQNDPPMMGTNAKLAPDDATVSTVHTNGTEETPRRKISVTRDADLLSPSQIAIKTVILPDGTTLKPALKDPSSSKTKQVSFNLMLNMSNENKMVSKSNRSILKTPSHRRCDEYLCDILS